MARSQKSTDSSSLAEVVDRILDKGIVIDAWVKVSLVGIELITIEARVVVASVETYLKYAEAGRPDGVRCSARVSNDWGCRERSSSSAAPGGDRSDHGGT